jgi:hypothetical protein
VITGVVNILQALYIALHRSTTCLSTRLGSQEPQHRVSYVNKSDSWDQIDADPRFEKRNGWSSDKQFYKLIRCTPLSKRITTFSHGSVCRFQDSLKCVDLLVLSFTPVSHIKLHCGVQSMCRLDGIHEGCRLGNGTNPEDFF